MAKIAFFGVDSIFEIISNWRFNYTRSNPSERNGYWNIPVRACIVCGIGTIATVAVGLIHGTPEKTLRQNNFNGVLYEIRKARRLTKGVLTVNIMSVLTNFAKLVETAIKEKIDIIFSGAGLPLDLPKDKTKDSKTRFAPV